MMDYREKFLTTKEYGKKFDAGLHNYMLKVYNYMALALSVTAGAAYVTIYFVPLTNLMYDITPAGDIQGVTGFGMIIQFIPLMIAFSFAFGWARMSIEIIQILIWVYAIAIGMSLSSLYFIYTGYSLVRTFFICSGLFAAMSIYGFTTKNDLTSSSSFLMMGLIGLIITSMINIFMDSPVITFTTSFIAIVVFTGLTAWDTQVLKKIYYYHNGNQLGQKASIMGAFALYLDFINLFLSLLNFLAKKRDK